MTPFEIYTYLLKKQDEKVKDDVVKVFPLRVRRNREENREVRELLCRYESERRRIIMHQRRRLEGV